MKLYPILGVALMCAACARDAKPAPQVGSTSANLMSYQEAMHQPVEIGDATAIGGECQLEPHEIVFEMDRHLDKIYTKCVVKEYRRGRRLDSVGIDLAILGDGTVQGATVDAGSRKFRTCVEDVIEDVTFPSFQAPRMGARYSFQTE